jgi:hypothetical protein
VWRERGKECLERFHYERQVWRGGRARWREGREDKLFIKIVFLEIFKKGDEGYVRAARSWTQLGSGISRAAKKL